MTTAFVLSGGGSLGSVQVGMLQALAEAGIEPDVLVGTSAGALNAAFVASHGADSDGAAELGRIWSGLRARDIFTVDPAGVATALIGRRDALCTDRGLRRLLQRHLTFDRIENSPIPLVIVATDLLSGQEVALSEGPAASAVLASAAIPGVFPTVRQGGRTLTDGGLANNTAISQAVACGADTIYVLPAGYPCALTEAPHSALGVATQAITLLIYQRLLIDMGRYADQVDLIVLPPPCPLRVPPTDFSQASELAAASYRRAVQWLGIDGGRRQHPERLVAMHTHPDGV